MTMTTTATSNFGDVIPVQRHSFWRDDDRCAINVRQERMNTRHQNRLRSDGESRTWGASSLPRSRRGVMARRAVGRSRSLPCTSTVPGLTTSPSLRSAVHAGAVRRGRFSTTSTTSWGIGRCPSCRGWSPRRVAGCGRIRNTAGAARGAGRVGGSVAQFTALSLVVCRPVTKDTVKSSQPEEQSPKMSLN